MHSPKLMWDIHTVKKVTEIWNNWQLGIWILWKLVRHYGKDIMENEITLTVRKILFIIPASTPLHWESPHRLVYVTQNNRSSYVGKSTSQLVSTIATASCHHGSHTDFTACSSISAPFAVRDSTRRCCYFTHYKFSVNGIPPGTTRYM